MLQKFRKKIGSYIKSVMLDCKFEALVWAAIVAVLVLQNFIPLEFSRTVEGYFKFPKENIVDVCGILIGIYMAIAFILAISTAPVISKMSVKNLDTQFIAIASTGFLGNIALMIFTMFVPTYSHWYYIVFTLMCLNVFVSLFKFFRLMVLMFKDNMETILVGNDKKTKLDDDISFYLKEIAENTKFPFK